MMSGAFQYFEKATRLIDVIRKDEIEKISLVAGWMCESILKNGVPHVFGAGHSTIPAKEVFIRAGTLSCIRAIGLEDILCDFERVEGVGVTLMRNYPMYPGEVLIIISNSGINPLPIEVALAGKEMGAKTIALTSIEHSKATSSRHSSGKRLFELTDLYIDTHVPTGDASLEVPGLLQKTGPLSTIAGTVIMNAIVAETIGKIVEKGETPPVRISRNLPGGDEHKQKFKEIFGDRIPEL
jgi:uncharacterized phosphosugar-binding protein